jgi:lipopolysaccharide export system protein LptA
LAYSYCLVVVVGTILFPVLGRGEGQKSITVITSKTMTASSQKNTAIFRENVKMVQDDLVVYSDVMIIYFKEKGPQISSPVGQTSSRKTGK